MKKSLFWLFLVSVGMFPLEASSAGESAASTFQKANEAYRVGDYGRAARLYESLIAKEWRPAAVYYNLGNAYFKQDEIGLALLNYERAKRIRPRDRDVSANLKYAASLLEYRIEDKRNWYQRALEAFLRSFTLREIGTASLALGALFWLSWGVPLYLRPGTPWGWKRKWLLVVTLGAFSLWGIKGIHEGTVKEAVVLKEKAPVRYGPSYKDQVALRLGEGLKVRLTKRSEEWSRVVLTNGETGWMSHEDLGVI